jgi:hypothetical protein
MSWGNFGCHILNAMKGSFSDAYANIMPYFSVCSDVFSFITALYFWRAIP